MFKKIEINNFRGINKLVIDNLKRINVFLGKNNCGKTSILESIFLVTGISNPVLNMTINNFRKLYHTEIHDFRFIFKDLDYNSDLKIIAKDLNGNVRQLTIKPNYITNGSESLQANILDNNTTSINDSSSLMQKIDGLCLNFKINKTQHKSIITMKFTNDIKNPIEINQIVAPEYQETLNGTFISPNLDSLYLNQRLDNIIVNKKEKLIIDALQLIDKNIIDIDLGTKNMIYIDVGKKIRFPLNIMGDGVRRILAILSVIIERENSIILIDEIENGLHFSSISILWEVIIKAAIENNVQLFITSHNYEILKYLDEVLANKGNEIQKEVNSYSIINENNVIKSYEYNYENFNHAIKQGVEIR